MFRDLRFGLRQLQRQPVFTLTAILTLALAIGANTAVFGVVDALVLRDLPVRNAHELLVVVSRSKQGQDVGFSRDLFTEFNRQQQVFSSLYAASHPDVLDCTTPTGPSKSSLQLVSGEYFSTLYVRPHIGRLINGEDDRAPGSGPVAVVSYKFWKNEFGGTQSILGQKVTINKQILTIVGVTGPDFKGDVVGEYPDLWVPSAMQQLVHRGLNVMEGGDASFLHVVGRPKPGFGKPQFAAGLAAPVEEIRSNSALSGKTNIRELAGFETSYGGRGVSVLRQRLTQPLMILVGIGGLVLLLACVNLANLLLARAAARQRELCVRIAIGAAQGQILKQLMTESLLLGAMGGLAGLLAGLWGSSLLARWVVPGGSPDVLALSLNLRTLGFTFAASLFTVILFGLGPALHAVRGSVASRLRVSAGQSRAQLRTAGFLVAGQVAISFVLLVEAGLFFQTMRNLRNQETGFSRKGVLQLNLDTASAGYTAEQLGTLYRRISDELKSIPAVRSSGFAFLDAVGGGSTEFCCVAAQNPIPGAPQSGQVSFNIITGGYLEAAGMKLLAGRSFDENGPPEKRVAVLNQAMARKFFGSGNPIGARLAMGDPPKAPFDVEVVGVVNNAMHSNLREGDVPMIYLPRQPKFRFHLRFLYVGTDNYPSLVSNAIIGRLRAIDPKISIQGAASIEQILDRELAKERLITRLASAFGILALLLTAIGLYGVMSYTVARRTSEIAVRIALGATPRRLLGLVLRSTLILLAAGLSGGLLITFGLARVVRSLLFGLTPTDPWVIALTSSLLAATALIAAYAPLRRALAIPASVAFRQE